MLSPELPSQSGIKYSVPGIPRAPGIPRRRETRGTGIPPATSMPWHNNGTACLAGSAVYPKFRCADNRLARKGAIPFISLTLPTALISITPYTDSRTDLTKALDLRAIAQERWNEA